MLNAHQITYRVLLVDDQLLFRCALQDLLENRPDIQVVGAAADGEAAIAMSHALQPDIVLMDICMPGLDGIAATAIITSELPRCKILALTAHETPAVATKILKAGATGFLPKDCSYIELMQAIQTVMAGEIYICSRIANALTKEICRLPDVNPAIKPLSPRETEIVRFLALGMSNRTIAQELGISIKTVETHRQQAMRKRNITSIAELTRHAIRTNLISA